MKEIQVHIGRRKQEVQANLTGFLLGGGGVDLTPETIEEALGYVPADDQDLEAVKESLNRKLDASELPEAVNGALTQAKESGEFDGPQGPEGPAGQDGANGADGDDGVGIASIAQTTTSAADGGENIITVTLTNGNAATFKVKNGSKGSKGDQGEDGKDGSDATVTDANIKIALGYTPAKQTDVRQLLEEIDDLGSVPAYVKTEAEEVANKIISNRTGNSLVLLMGSDIHVIADSTATAYGTTKTAIQHMGMGMNEIQNHTGIDGIILLGDYVYETANLSKSEAIDAMKWVKKSVKDAMKGIPTIWLDGNHDYYDHDNVTYRLTDGEHFALVGANNSKDTIVDSDNFIRNYGYIDYEKQRIRVIYLNTTDISGGVVSANYITDTQGQWLINTALNLTGKADEEKWGVVVCTHFPLYDANFTHLISVLKTYADKGSNANYGVSYDYSTHKAELIGHFHGHIHNFKVFEYETNGGKLIKSMCIPNACPNRENPYTGDAQETDENGNKVSYPKTAGTAEDTSFNVVIIDRDNEEIRAICYGAGYDRVVDYTETAQPTIINQIPRSTNSSGAIYNGVGYADGVRLGSDGADRTGASVDATGFIPVKQGDFLYFDDCQIVSGTNYNEIAFYKSDKSYINKIMPTASTIANWGGSFGDDNYLDYICTTKPASISWDFSDLAFVRVTGNYIGADSVITVNQPIE